MYKEFHFERSRHGDLHDHQCLKSKQEVFVLFRFGYVYNVRRLSASSAVASRKGFTTARSHFTTHPLTSLDF